jgi:NitT/TauT family transport system substrate-binding protein
MNKIIIGLILIILIFGGVWYFNNKKVETKPTETVKVRVTSMPVVQGLPLYLAMDKGYFKEAGLDVTFVKFESPNQIIDALLQGKVDATPPSAATGVIGIADYKNPGKLKIYSLGGGDKVIQNDAILVKNDSPIESLQDLKGKKLGIIAGSVQWKIFAKHILAENNLEAYKDVALVELSLGLQAQALSSGQVDAILTVEPIPTLVKSKGLGRELVDHAAAKFVANPFYSGAGVLRKGFVEKNPTTTLKFLAVMDRAINEINQNPNAARKYLKEHTGLDDTAIKNVPISKFKMYSDFTQDDRKAMNNFFELFTKYKVIDGNIDFQKISYSTHRN